MYIFQGYHVIYIPADTMPLGYEVTLEVSSKISGMADGKQSVTIVTSGLPITGTFDVQPRSGTVVIFQCNYLPLKCWGPSSS